MQPILIAYASREGHTHRIADHIVQIVTGRGHEAALLNVFDLHQPVDLGEFGAAILAASIHAGLHEDAMVRFVKLNRLALEALPTAFLTISLTEATVEDESRSEEERAEAAEQVEAMVRRFFEDTGWAPDRLKPVAGALMYTKYGFVLRWAMRRIARDVGVDTDTSVDHVYTDWEALDQFVQGFLTELEAAAARLRPTAEPPPPDLQA